MSELIKKQDPYASQRQALMPDVPSQIESVVRIQIITPELLRFYIVLEKKTEVLLIAPWQSR